MLGEHSLMRFMINILKVWVMRGVKELAGGAREISAVRWSASKKSPFRVINLTNGWWQPGGLKRWRRKKESITCTFTQTCLFLYSVPHCNSSPHIVLTAYILSNRCTPVQRQFSHLLTVDSSTPWCTVFDTDWWTVSLLSVCLVFWRKYK